MALSAQEHLDLIDAVIQKRLAGDAYERYTEAEAHFAGTPMKELYEIRAQLIAEGGAGGSNFRLAEPFEE